MVRKDMCSFKFDFPCMACVKLYPQNAFNLIAFIIFDNNSV